ncbi:hypothetical protein GOV12_06120 [Candidatus Pacearchaeota archaeon]|nr:hypothetical protein [Candidatus Pacearchaeota archaeon]
MVSLNKSSIMYSESRGGRKSFRCLSCPVEDKSNCVICPFNNDYDDVSSKRGDGDYNGFPETEFSSKRLRGDHSGLEDDLELDFSSMQLRGDYSGADNVSLMGAYHDSNTLRSDYPSIGFDIESLNLGYESEPLGYSLTSGSSYIDSGSTSDGSGGVSYESSGGGFHDGYE